MVSYQCHPIQLYMLMICQGHHEENQLAVQRWLKTTSEFGITSIDILAHLDYRTVLASYIR